MSFWSCFMEQLVLSKQTPQRKKVWQQNWPRTKEFCFFGEYWCSYFLLMRIFFLLSCWNHSVYKRWLIVHPVVCGLLLWGLRLMIWVALVNWTHMTRANGWADRETENTVCSHIGEILWNHCLFYNNRRLNIQNKHVEENLKLATDTMN